MTPAPLPSGATRGAWRRDDIQGLRAVAVLLVVAYHSGLPVPGGFVGVDVFFVISGFVITELILRSLGSPQGFRFRTFYGRRMKRLLPALALMTSITLVLAVLLESPFGAQQATASTALGATFFVANFVIYSITGGYFDAPAEANPLLHTWSLSVEEQFYFIFPALMVFAWWIARRRLRDHGRSTAVVLLAALTLGSFALGVGTSLDLITIPGIERPVDWAYYSSLTRAWEFAVGALLALALTHAPPRWGRAPRQVLSASGGALILASAVWITAQMPFPGFVALVPVVGTLLVIAAGSNIQAAVPAVSRALAVPLMVWIGALSYSWYLWHWPVIVYSRSLFGNEQLVALTAGAVSLLPAWLAYRFVENPLRSNTAIRGRRIIPLVAVVMTIPALLALGLTTGARNSWGSDAIKDMSAQITPLPISHERGCDNNTPLGDAAVANCTWNGETRGAPIYLVGDSQAGQLAEGVIGAGQIQGRPVTIGNMNSCPFILTAADEQPLSAPDCLQYVKDSTAWLESQKPASVVIAMSPNYVTAEFKEPLKVALERAVTGLQDAGHRVVIVQAVPQFPSWSPTDCTLLDAIRDETGCVVAESRTQMDARQQLALDMLSETAADTGATLVDLRPELCTDEECATNQGSVWTYRDLFHITVGESQRLTPALAAGIPPAAS